jgi:hypothetical protein
MLSQQKLLHVTVYANGHKLMTFGRIVSPIRVALERHRFDKLPHHNQTTSPNIVAKMGATALFPGRGY